MESFDPDFEQMRLDMLAKQYPDIASVNGKVTIIAMEYEDCIAKLSWDLEQDIFNKMNESGFKLQLISLLDNFIAYRARCNKMPRKEGMVRFESGVISIEWMI